MFTLPCYFVRNLKEEQIQIRFNLVVAIAIAQITFLAGIEASALQGTCSALVGRFMLGIGEF